MPIQRASLQQIGLHTNDFVICPDAIKCLLRHSPALVRGCSAPCVLTFGANDPESEAKSLSRRLCPAEGCPRFFMHSLKSLIAAIASRGMVRQQWIFCNERLTRCYTLPACASKSSAPRLAEAFPSGTASAPTAALCEPGLSTGKLEPKLKSQSATTLSIGFCSEPLPTCARKSNRLPISILVPLRKAHDTRQSAAWSCSTLTSTMCSDCCSCVNCSR